MWASPGADVGQSPVPMCGQSPAPMWASPGADVGQSLDAPELLSLLERELHSCAVDWDVWQLVGVPGCKDNSSACRTTKSTIKSLP